MGPVETALQLIDRYGVAIVALVAVAAFAVWVTRLLFQEQQRRFDEVVKLNHRSLDISERQVAATQELTSELHKALDNRGELMELLREAVGKLAGRRST